MKLLLPQQPQLRWLCFQFRHTTISPTPKNYRLITTLHNFVGGVSLGGISSDFKKWAPQSSEIPDLLEASPSVEERNTILSTVRRMRKPHHLHVYATKHNTHITLSNGERKPIISVSAGNIGFRKAGRGSYDAGYQLGSYVMGRIKQRGLLQQIESIELVLRDFGAGREAIQKILLGAEGNFVREKIVRVMDASRLKFGGVRGKRPRRLG